MIGKYCYSSCGSEYQGEADTLEEAVIEVAKGMGLHGVVFGKYDAQVSYSIDGEDILDTILENLSDTYGMEDEPTRYIPSYSAAIKDEIKSAVSKVLDKHPIQYFSVAALSSDEQVEMRRLIKVHSKRF